MTNQNVENTEVNANEKWDEILSSDEGLELLDNLATDALIDFENGKFTPMNQESTKD